MMKKLLTLFSIFALTVAIHAQSIGDFQTGASGPWSDSDTWLEYVFPGIWNNTANVPDGTSTVEIRNGHAVARNSALAVSGSLTIAGGGDLDMTGYTLSRSGSGTILIQSDAANGSGELICQGSPFAIVQRYIEATDNSYWHQIGVPVSGQFSKCLVDGLEFYRGLPSNLDLY